MTCEQVEELLGVYAVDALSGDEAASFGAHIATCAIHAAKAADLRATASLLADTAAPVAPPAGLRARILEAASAAPQEPAALQVTPIADARRRREAKTASVGTGWFSPNAWTAIAAVVAMIAVGLGAWALSVSTDSDAQQFASAATSITDLTDGSGTRVGTVVYFEDDRQAAVFIDELPDAGEGNSYQMWAIEDGAPVSIAVMDEGTAGEVVSVVPIDAEASSALAITVEPAGGSDRPTSDPVFTSEI